MKPSSLSWRHALASCAAAAGAGALGLLYGWQIERHHARLHQIDVRFPGLPDAFDGYRIAQLSDFHIGGMGWSERVMQGAIAIVREQQPDLIVLTGDYVETTPGIGDWISLFGDLQAPDGVLAVLGNHDYHGYGVRVEPLIHALEQHGIRVLRNASTSVNRCGRRLWIVGLDDPHSGHEYLPKALAGVPSDAKPLLLVHYPDYTWRLAPDRWALALSGHAHGAQVRLPLAGRYFRHHIARTRFSHGMYSVNGIQVYVNAGLGTSGRPVRLFSPPEVTLLRLRTGRA